MYGIRCGTIALAAIIATQIACTQVGDHDAEEAGKAVVVFHSAADPGIWEAQSADHEPEVTVTRDGDNKIINVNIPFAHRKERNHYVETILILDLQRNEMNKVSFARNRPGRGAKFKFPADYHTPVYVVMKCNRHGMWEKLVDWDE